MQKLMRAMHKNEKGFTLVELMVVVVIIGILVAIAIPLYGGIQETARQNAHEANIRTLQGAGAIYVAEEGPTGSSTDWTDETFPYIDTWPKDPWDDNGTYTLTINGDDISVASTAGP